MTFGRSGAQDWAPERARMSKIKNGGLDQYGAEPLEQQQFETAGFEGVKLSKTAFQSKALWRYDGIRYIIG